MKWGRVEGGAVSREGAMTLCGRKGKAKRGDEMKQEERWGESGLFALSYIHISLEAMV